MLETPQIINHLLCVCVCVCVCVCMHHKAAESLTFTNIKREGILYQTEW
jgi:hypothetical protein